MICSRVAHPGALVNTKCPECGHPVLAHMSLPEADLSYCAQCDAEHLRIQLRRER